MPADIDSLQIQISAQTTKASASINLLVKKIDKLSASLGTLNGHGLKSLANGVSQLGTAVQTIDASKTNGFAAIARNIKALSKIDAVGVGNVSNGLTSLSGGLNALSSVGNLNNVVPAINAIKNLARVDLKNFDTAKLDGISKSMSAFATQMSGISKIDSSISKVISAMARLANSGAYIGTTATYFPQLGTQVVNLTQRLSSADNIDLSISKIVDGIARLASAGNKVGATAANLGVLGDGVVDLISRLNNVPQVNANVANLVYGLGNIASSGARSGYAITGLSNRLNAFSNSSKGATKKAFSLASAIGKVYATYWLLFRAMGKVKSAIDLSSDLTEVQNVVDVTFGEYASLVEDMSKTSITDFGMSELTVKEVSSRFQAMGTAMGFTQGKMADMSIELTKLTADMASFYNMKQEDVAQDLESIFTGQTRPLRTYGLDLTEATLKEWAMSQGINANMDAMSQMEKTMLRYRYVLANTGAAQGDFARTSDTWANQTRILQQNIESLSATIGRTFINALKPVVKGLNIVIGKLHEFAKAVSNSLGVIFGWKYEEGNGGLTTDIIEGSNAAEDLSGGLADATNNAKKLKQQVQGIDELNILTSKDSTDNGSGMSGLNDDYPYGQSGQWVKDENLLDYESKLDTLYKLGDFIGTTIKNQLEGIDWNDVYSSADDFGEGLADFLNGLISPELFYSLGKTIANSLNTAILASLTFADNFDFSDFGLSIANGVNGFFENFDFAQTAKTINKWVHGLEDTLISAVANLNYKAVLCGITEFMEEIDIDVVTLAIGAIAWKYKGKEIAFGALKSLLSKTISTGIGNGTVSIATSLSLMITTAMAGFKIGNMLYDHVPKVQELSDALVKWIFGGKDTINVSRTITMGLGGFVIAISAAKVATALAGIVATQVVPAAATALGNSAALASSCAIMGTTITNALLVGLGTALGGYTLGKILYDNNFFSFGEVTDKIAEELIHQWDRTLSLLPESVRDFAGGYVDEEYMKDLENNSVDIGPFRFDTDKIGKLFQGTAFGDLTDDVIGGTFDALGIGDKITAEADKQLAEVERRAAWKKVGTSIGEQINAGFAGVSLFKNALETGKSLIEKYFPTLAEKGKGLANSLSNGIAQGKEQLKNTVVSLFNNSVKNQLGNNQTLKQKGSDLIQGFVWGVYAKWHDGAQSLNGQLTTLLKNTTNNNIGNNQTWKTPGKNLVQGLSKGIEENWGNSNSKNSSTLVGKVNDMASKLTSSLKNFFGIHSPSRVWSDEIGKYLTLGLQEGILGEETKVQKSITGMGLRLSNSMSNAMEVAYPPSFLNFGNDMTIIGTTTHQFNTSGIGKEMSAEFRNSISGVQDEQNTLLRQQNELLYQILQKDAISGDDIYDIVVAKNRKTFNRTGASPLFV